MRDFYEQHPYPRLTGTGVRHRLGGHLQYFRHVLWPWRPELRGLRMLDAGCGTGETAVTAALLNPDVAITAIDLSSTSLEQAENLAKLAGVGDRIRFEHLAVENVASLGRQFDYINCVGVLHHLADPDMGLRALTGVLASDGGMQLMLYATYGRAKVYMLQALFRMFWPEHTGPDRMRTVRKLVGDLLSGATFPAAEWRGFPVLEDDESVADLLLHPQDRSYTVPQIFGLVRRCGLHFIKFLHGAVYDPCRYVSDEGVREKLRSLPAEQQAYAAEILNGGLNVHVFFVGNEGNARRRAEAEKVEFADRFPVQSPRYRWDEIREIAGGQPVFELRESAPPPVFESTVQLAPGTLEVLALCDGTRSVRELAAMPAIKQAQPAHAAGDSMEFLKGLLMVAAAGELVVLSPVRHSGPPS